MMFDNITRHSKLILVAKYIGTLRGAFLMQQKIIIIQRAQPQKYLVLLISRIHPF